MQYDEHFQSLRDTNMLMTSLNISNFSGKCIASILCCSPETGSFVSLLYKSNLKPDRYLFCKFDWEKQAIFGLTSKEFYQLRVVLEKHCNRFENDFKFDCSKLKNVSSTLDQLENKIKGDELLEYDEFLLLKSDISKNTICKTFIRIGNQEFDIHHLGIVQPANFSACSFVFDVSLFQRDILNKFSLYNETMILCNFPNHPIGEIGIIVSTSVFDNEVYCMFQSYPAEMLQDRRITLREFKNILFPSTVVRYLVESSDNGVNGVNIQGEKEVENTYLVATAVKNFQLNNLSFIIDEIHFNEEISISDDFTKLLNEDSNTNYIIIWMYLNAKNHVEAMKNASDKFEDALNVVLFFIRSDLLYYNYGLSDDLQNWEIRNHNPQVRLINKLYIENCFSGEAVIEAGGQVFEPTVRVLSEVERDHLLNSWIEQGYEKAVEANSDLKFLLPAIRWINMCWSSENECDKIIYANMALEFCLNGERGNSIIEDILESYGLNKEIAKMTSKAIIANFTRDRIVEIDGLDREICIDLEKKMNGQIKQALTNSSFMSNLHALIFRLNIPIEESELDLISSVRKLRNTMIHGRNLEKMRTLDMKKLCGIISRIIAYKFKDIIDEARKL